MALTHERKVFTLLVEMRCNSYCVFCGQRQVDEGLVKARRRLGLSTPKTSFGDLRGRFTLETATAALEAARNEGYDELSLQGGEPTLFPDLPALIRAARSMGFLFIGLVTNGRRLAEEGFTSAILEAGLDAVTFSVLGHDAKTHDALAIAPGSFDELLQGMRNAARTSASTSRSVTINVNLIPTKDSLGHLAEQVRTLHDAGAHALSLHLIRFDGLASDPAVKSALAFDIASLTRVLGDAWAVADHVGAGLHASEIPICVHPALRPTELERLEKRAAVTKHGYGAASFGYDSDPLGRVNVIPCEGCLLRSLCPRVPAEYLPDEPSDVLRPLTGASIAEGVELLLADLDPASGVSVARVVDRKRSVASIGRLGANQGQDEGERLSASLARLDEGLADLGAIAYERADMESFTLAFGGRLGLHAPEWKPEEVLRIGKADVRELVRAAGALPEGRDANTWRLRLAWGFDVAFTGERERDDEMSVTRARPVHRAARSRGDRLFVSLFIGGLASVFRNIRRVRLGHESVDIDRGEGWVRALRLDSGSSAHWVRPSLS